MSYASPSDVAARLGRPLTVEEEAQATVLLSDAETLIAHRVGDIADAITDDRISQAVVVMVEANSVVRYLRNPGGVRSETVGPVSYAVDTRAAAGFVTILDSEWGLLGVTAGAFSVAPTYAANDVNTPWSSAYGTLPWTSDLDGWA